MKASPSQGKGAYHIQAEINMIPLIDVALVLVIIFMVISPILVQSQLRVNLPKVTSSSTAEETALKVEIAPDGTLAFDGKVVTRDELRQRLAVALPSGHKASLLIEADQDVSFQNVVYVMDLAKQFKIEKLGVSVLPQIHK